jgi:hypothetical protein
MTSCAPWLGRLLVSGLFFWTACAGSQPRTSMEPDDPDEPSEQADAASAGRGGRGGG